MNRIFLSPLLLGIVAVGTTSLSAEDWPQFLGPDRDGKSAEVGWNTDWDNDEPAILWKADLGRGCSSFAVADGKAYATGNSGDQDTVFCLDAVTGKELWKHSYKQALDPKFYKGGTSATPTVDGDYVYVVGKEGDLFCLRTNNGEVVWQKNFQKAFGAKRQMWGWAAAPLIEGKMLIVDPGGKGASAVALNKATGEVIWQSGDDQHGYTPPIRFTHEGTDGVLLFSGTGLHGFALKDGKPLFRYPWKTRYDINASTPVPFGDNCIFLSSGYKTGCGAIRLGAGGAVEELYRNDELSLQFQAPVKVGEHLYAVDGAAGSQKAHLRCLHLPTGAVAWSEKFSGELGTLIQVGAHFLIMKSVGELQLAKLSPKGYSPLASLQILRKDVWAAPAFANGLLYARNNDGQAVCVDLRKPE